MSDELSPETVAAIISCLLATPNRDPEWCGDEHVEALQRHINWQWTRNDEQAERIRELERQVSYLTEMKEDLFEAAKRMPDEYRASFNYHFVELCDARLPRAADQQEPKAKE